MVWRCCYYIQSLFKTEYDDINDISDNISDNISEEINSIEIKEIILPISPVCGRFISMSNDNIQIILEYKNILLEMYVVLFDFSVVSISEKIINEINETYRMFPIEVKWMDIYCNTSLYNRICKIIIIKENERINLSDLLHSYLYSK